MQIAITTQDDKPLPDKANRDLFYTITYTFAYDPQNPSSGPSIKMDKVQLDSDGTYTLIMKPRAKTQSFSIQVNKSNSDSLE